MAAFLTEIRQVFQTGNENFCGAPDFCLKSGDFCLSTRFSSLSFVGPGAVDGSVTKRLRVEGRRKRRSYFRYSARTSSGNQRPP